MGDPKSRLLDCGTHGRVPWDGQCMCVTCGALWWLAADEDNEHSPEKAPYCDCGMLLVPAEGDDRPRSEIEFTGRAVCPSCYEDHFPRVPAHLRSDA